MYKKQSIGKFGENVACKYLKKNNYKVLDRNFNCSWGEIDVVAFDIGNKEVVFFEVKTRTNFNYGFPSEAVNKLKQKHILNSAKYYLYCKGFENKYVRFDVIEIVIDTSHYKYKLNHLINVFN
ncbi:MAG: YraN family protein [Clostridia bacterium]|nr:YraN family protein [Clostridia bacterium]